MAITPNTHKAGEYSDAVLICVFHVSPEELLDLQAKGMTSGEIAELQRQRYQAGTLVKPKVTYRKVSSLRKALRTGSDDGDGFPSCEERFDMCKSVPHQFS